MGMRMTRIMLGAWAVLASLGQTAEAAEEEDSSRDSCIAVELIMYSGRPKPLYFICGEAEKQEVLAMISGAKEEKPSDTTFPRLESTPAYQGMLVTLPGKPEERRGPILIRKGFVKPYRGALRKDSGRNLEKHLLKRSLRESDKADSPARGTPLSRVAEGALERVEREPVE